MTKLKGILLTQGMHGMISQVEGLAKALDLDFTHHTVETNKFWKIFPPKLTPISQKVFKKIDVEDFDVIISCGRKSVIPSIYLKKNSSKKVTNIHIQDPKVNLANFSYVIAPEHDGLTGKNIFSTKGAIHYLTKNEIDNNSDYLNVIEGFTQCTQVTGDCSNCVNTLIDPENTDLPFGGYVCKWDAEHGCLDGSSDIGSTQCPNSDYEDYNDDAASGVGF